MGLIGCWCWCWEVAIGDLNNGLGPNTANGPTVNADVFCWEEVRFRFKSFVNLFLF